MGIDAEELERARQAYHRRNWVDARNRYRAATELDQLPAADALALGDAAWWLGLVEESLAAGDVAYRRSTEEEQPRAAAMAAIGMAVNHFLRGDAAAGSGWISRAQRALEQLADCPEHGYLQYLLKVEAALGGPDLEAVATSARRVGQIGRRHHDPNLIAVAAVGEGRARIKQGRVTEGMGMLDDAMLAVASQKLSPEWAGNIYCHLMAACHEVGDIERAAAWTEATSRWLETLSAAVLFSGICRVHRSQVLQIRGTWDQAEREAARVCEDLEHIHLAAAAEGHYQVGELRRLRGDLAGAEEAYARAHERGRDPQPGLALLRLAQGSPEAASASIRAALAGAQHALDRFELCAAQVEIALAGGDVERAARASRELDSIAGTYASSGMQATAVHARGALALAGDRIEAALTLLRDACRRWRALDAPYHAARASSLLARAYLELSDADAARREIDVAASAFDRLGAFADARQVTALRARPQRPGGLSAREVEVLVLVAAGKTNREVAGSLSISEKTVARHLSNIFTKLGLTTRTAAAAYAFEHDLASPSRG